LAGGFELYGYVSDTNTQSDFFGLNCEVTAKLQAHADAAKAEAKLSENQNKSIIRSLERAKAAKNVTEEAKHLSMAEKKKKLYMGTQVDTLFKKKVDADKSLMDAGYKTTPRGKKGPDVTGPDYNLKTGTGSWWDLTTQKSWDRGGHQKAYGKEGGKPIFW